MYKPANNKTTIELMEMRKSDTPKIAFQYEALLKMHQIVHECKCEVGWLGSVEIINGTYVITDVYLLNQKVTGVTTELDEEALSDLLLELVQEDPKKYETIKLWGHSHVQISCTPSGTDNDTFKEYYQDNPFFIRLIMNQKEEMRLDIAVKETGTIYNNVGWEIIYPPDIIDAMLKYTEALDKLEKCKSFIDELHEAYASEFEDELKKEIKDKVVEESKYGYYNTQKYGTKDKGSWTDKEMDDYASWYDGYDYYGYSYYGYGSDIEDALMVECDCGEYVLVDEALVTVTTGFDGFEIADAMESCKTWKELRNIFTGDPRVLKYTKRDWITLYEAMNKTYKEYKRRIAA